MILCCVSCAGKRLAGPRTVQKYSDAFKLTPGRLSLPASALGMEERVEPREVPHGLQVGIGPA